MGGRLPAVGLGNCPRCPPT